MAVRRFREKKIKELMRPPSAYASYEVSRDTKIQNVASQLEQSPQRMVVVLDANKIPVGLVTQTDLLKGFGAGKRLDQTVEDFMNSNIVKISEDGSVDQAIQLMNSFSINKLVVVGVDGTFAGVIHKSDIIRETQKLL